MTNKTRKWIRAGLETLIHGGAAAVGSAFSAAVVDSIDFGLLSQKSLKLMAGTFLVNGGLRFFQWWANNPLPPDDDTAPPFAGAQPQISLSPLGKVQPMQTQDSPKQ
jgi:hypothetical protein